MVNTKSKMLVTLGVAQVGVIVEGSFCCGSFVKQARMAGTEGVYAHSLPFLFFDYGFLCLIIPMVWTILAVYYCEKEEPSFRQDALLFGSGLLMAVLPGLYFLGVAAGGYVETFP